MHNKLLLNTILLVWFSFLLFLDFWHYPPSQYQFGDHWPNFCSFGSRQNSAHALQIMLVFHVIRVFRDLGWSKFTHHNCLAGCRLTFSLPSSYIPGTLYPAYAHISFILWRTFSCIVRKNGGTKEWREYSQYCPRTVRTQEETGRAFTVNRESTDGPRKQSQPHRCLPPCHLPGAKTRWV